jgi:thymidylate synthase
LKEDQDSRQAVLTIWRENPIASRDVPCTLSMQFFLRKASGELFLHCITNMRSNDIWLGTPYDSFNFSAISFYIALFLNKEGIKCKLGKLTINAGSRHLYEVNLIKAQEVIACQDTFPLNFSFNNLIDKYKHRPEEFIRNLYQGAEEKENIPQVKLNYL